MEYESKEFHADVGADKIDRDVERANSLRAQGYSVLEATPGVIGSLTGMSTLAHQIARMLRVPLVDPDPSQRALRRRLYDELFVSGL